MIVDMVERDPAWRLRMVEKLAVVKREKKRSGRDNNL